MPPHLTYRLSPYINSKTGWRGIKWGVLAASILLAGCATTAPTSNYADISSTRQLRDNYLARTTSDPLGAYLKKEHTPAGGTLTPARSFASTALNMLGIKYRLGGGAPNTGFDCSGLVIYAAEKSLGLKLPRVAAEIAREGTSVKRSELKKGDLVFFNTLGKRNSHVGIYLGDQKFVHAPRTGAVVRVESMAIAYWKKRYNGARRLAAAPKVAADANMLASN